MIKKTIKFNVYPSEDTNSVFIAHVYPSRDGMNRQLRKWFKSVDVAKGALVHFSPIRYGRRKVKQKLLGYIFLNAQDFTASTISHECGHAAFVFLESLGKKRCLPRATRGGVMKIENVEETFCYALGAMVEQVNAGVRKNHKVTLRGLQRK